MDHPERDSKSSGYSNRRDEDNRPTQKGDLLQKLQEIDQKLSQISRSSGAPNALLTRKDLADQLQCSVRTVDTLVAQGEIQTLRIRGCIRFSPDAIDAYLRRVAGSSK